MSCADGWSFKPEEINGVCPDCGEDTVDGEAAEGCHWSPMTCKTCGAQPCDQSC